MLIIEGNEGRHQHRLTVKLIRKQIVTMNIRPKVDEKQDVKCRKLICLLKKNDIHFLIIETKWNSLFTHQSSIKHYKINEEKLIVG